MSKEEARRVISSELKRFRDMPYADLVKMIGSEPITVETNGPGGKRYQSEIVAFWDDKPDDDVRVMGCVDDGGWRVFGPLTDSFIKSPTGEFRGE